MLKIISYCGPKFLDFCTLLETYGDIQTYRACLWPCPIPAPDVQMKLSET